jgi:hypothetical protein
VKEAVHKSYVRIKNFVFRFSELDRTCGYEAAAHYSRDADALAISGLEAGVVLVVFGAGQQNEPRNLDV